MNETVPRRAERLEVNEAEDGLVIYDPGRGMVHHLNPSASLIFDLCDGTRDIEAIARRLAEVFALDAPPRDDVLGGVRDLVERSLVRWNGQGAGEG